MSTMDERPAKRGISFYFFDLDDNTLFLKTPIILRNRADGEETRISTGDLARYRADWSRQDWSRYEVDYRHFRDLPTGGSPPGAKQYLVQDIEDAIRQQPASTWQAPSWDLFAYACRKQRPLAFVTARGHSRETIRAGIRVLVERGLIAAEPNYLAIYAVGNPDIQAELIASLPDGPDRQRLAQPGDHTSAFKRIAIRNTVEAAVQRYGVDEPHRFGMSDDDPENVDLIIKAMCDCKQRPEYRHMRFFVINTHQGEHVKLEVFPMDYPVTGQADDDECIG